jgi:hypothetical protein
MIFSLYALLLEEITPSTEVVSETVQPLQEACLPLHLHQHSC